MTAVLCAGIEAGGEHFGVVDDEHVALAEILTDIPEYAVLYPVGRPVVDEQPGTVARFRGRLGYELGGKFVIKI